MAAPSAELESLRRQLEGRWEHLERAKERYTALTRRLDAFQWRQELRKQPGLVRETQEREAELREVLTYVEQRAEREQWPAQHPGRLVVNELHAQQRRLESSLRRCLSRPQRRKPLPLLQLLEQVEMLALEPEPEPPTPDEHVLVRGGEWASGLRGRYWLTARRLVWKTWGGTLLQVKLEALSPEDVHIEAAGWGVRVEGPRSTFLRYGWRMGSLARIIDLCRHLPTAHHVDSRVRDVAVCRAYAHAEHFPTESRWGVAIFRPGSVVFLPTRRLTAVEHLLRLFGREARPAEDSELMWQEALVEHLRRLSPTAFDEVLRELAQVRDGLDWPSAEVRAAPDARAPLQFTYGGRILGLAPSARMDVLKPFFAAHMPRLLARPSPRKGIGSLFRLQGMVILGMALSFLTPVLTLWTHLPTHGWRSAASILTRVFFAWACMRYAKARNYAPWVGLGVSVIGMFGGLFLLFTGNKKEKSKRLPGVE